MKINIWMLKWKLRKSINKIMCFLGLHQWAWHEDQTGERTWACRYCGKELNE